MTGNKAQADHWASPSGLAWIEHEDALDAAIAGMLEVTLDAAGIACSTSRPRAGPRGRRAWDRPRGS